MILFVTLIGLILGSFASAMTYRLPQGVSIVWDRSSCPQCKHNLGILDLVPFFSWLFLRGKCRHCGHNISAIYPAIEILTTLACLGLYAAMNFTITPELFILMTVMPLLVAALFIDWKHMIIPDQINLSLSILGIIFISIAFFYRGQGGHFLLDRMAAAILLPAICFFAAWIVSKIKGRQALGMGDIKFMPAVGLFLGVSALPAYMITSGVFGLVSALLWSKTKGGGVFPFGPALILSFYVHLILTSLGFIYIK